MEPLDDFYADHPFVDWYKTTQYDEHSQHFSKEIYLMIINFENAASHKYVLQEAESLWVARSKMTGY